MTIKGLTTRNGFWIFPCMRRIVAIMCFLVVAISCSLFPGKKETQTALKPDTIVSDSSFVYVDTSDPLYVHTGNTQPAAVVTFAQTLIGVPYKYASADPAVGFDCSGFITYVFNHFNITVPRSSEGFTKVPYEVPLENAKSGDLILFTGTDSTIRIVGHMGIVVQSLDNELQFIHSTSGKANGVTITPLNDYYRGRFIKIVRVFPQSEQQTVR